MTAAQLKKVFAEAQKKVRELAKKKAANIIQGLIYGSKFGQWRNAKR